MNSIIQAVEAGFPQREAEGIMLVRLRDRLTGLGVNAELRDNNSVLLVHRPAGGLPVWVFVGYGGAYYSWQNAEKRHPTSDPEGAANVLAEYVAR
ncbi:hypothetical protein [Nonomuraea sp. NPDC005692]|uniref:hypothetical protein n=1 Tax=Nonomuraea sp. NPDC005692 TaxID=3157168 RepID=UPI0033E872AA